jgi:hypothetical protein
VLVNIARPVDNLGELLLRDADDAGTVELGRRSFPFRRFDGTYGRSQRLPGGFGKARTSLADACRNAQRAENVRPSFEVIHGNVRVGIDDSGPRGRGPTLDPGSNECVKRGALLRRARRLNVNVGKSVRSFKGSAGKF